MKTILCLILLGSLSVSAQFFQSFSGGDDLNIGPGTGGASFATDASVHTINALGVWASSGTLFDSHKVGLWDATTHALLASVTVPANGATPLNGFWYASIAPLTLTPSHAYVLGAQYADNDFDMVRGNATSLTTAPWITFGNALLSSGSGFEFPDLVLSSVNFGFFGANAAFLAVPEPTSALVVALLLIAMPLAVGSAKVKKGELSHARRQQPRIEEVESPPATNRPPVTPGNVNGNRPVIPPGLEKQNYATP